MVIDRRTLLKTFCASAALLPSHGLAWADRNDVFLSAAKINGASHARLFDSRGLKLGDIKLPGRGHGGAFNIRAQHGVIFARRPGDFAIVFNSHNGRVLNTLKTPPQHHFYGHGAYSADGKLLFTTENNYENTRGVIGVWDVKDHYRRVGSFRSFGLGPHDIALMPDGRTLVIANGGLETHPDSGRRKLNIPDMAPNLVLIDTKDGRLIQQHSLPRELHKLSIRHLAVNQAGDIGVALQYQGYGDDLPPLVFTVIHGRLKLLAANKKILNRMNNYCGSIVMDRSGTMMAVSCPRGDLVTFWQTETGALIDTVNIQDGCGLTPTHKPFTFLLSAGTGQQLIYNARTKAQTQLSPASGIKWDNHIQTSGTL